MRDTSRCRERTEGWLGRKRTYRCLRCHKKFQVDTLDPIPSKERICLPCRNSYPYTFVDKATGEKQVVYASDAELATLRAWQINPNLTYKGVED